MAATATSKKKAAMLLMNLDSATAAEMLKELGAEEIEQIAVEMAQINASGPRDEKKQDEIVREFCISLRKGQSQSQRLNVQRFLNETLVEILDKEKVEEIQSKVRKATRHSDIFEPIRSASGDELALALEGEHPQTVATVLLALEPKKVQEVLPLLDKDFCCKVAWKMAKPAQMGAGVRQRMASTVGERLKSFKGETIVAKPEKTLRELAIVLSDVEQELRNQILDDIKERDKETATMVRNLMMTWEDIPSIADRSLQEALRAVDANKLAIALYQADEEIAQKIRANISERAAAGVEEEMSLMQEPLEKEILDAREEVVDPLRKANEEGTLRRTKQ
jgi:flagellar motor switch protein FliG